MNNADVPEILTVKVELTIEIDANEWRDQFPEDNTVAIIASEVAEQLNAYAVGHYEDQRWGVVTGASWAALNEKGTVE